MGKTKLKAFSEGVIAIIITIMVFILKVQHGTIFESLTPLLTVFLSYVLSFVHIGIYWNYQPSYGAYGQASDSWYLMG